jgi:hypothetical protein
MLVLDSFEPRVPRPIQLEGTGFFLHGRVRVVARERARVHAVVRAGRPHDVTIELTPAAKVAVACDCVGFQETLAVCRHLWAALITVQNEDMLRMPPVAAAVP